MPEDRYDYRERERTDALIAERERMNKVSEFFYEIPIDLATWLKGHGVDLNYAKGKFDDGMPRIALPKDPALRRGLIEAMRDGTEALVEYQSQKRFLGNIEHIMASRRAALEKIAAGKSDNRMISEMEESSANRRRENLSSHLEFLEDMARDTRMRIESEPYFVRLIQKIEVAIRNAQLAVGTSAYEEHLKGPDSHEVRIIHE